MSGQECAACGAAAPDDLRFSAPQYGVNCSVRVCGSCDNERRYQATLARRIRDRRAAQAAEPEFVELGSLRVGEWFDSDSA